MNQDLDGAASLFDQAAREMISMGKSETDQLVASIYMRKAKMYVENRDFRTATSIFTDMWVKLVEDILAKESHKLFSGRESDPRPLIDAMMSIDNSVNLASVYEFSNI